MHRRDFNTLKRKRVSRKSTTRTNLVSFALTTEEADALMSQALTRRISVSRLVRQSLDLVDVEDDTTTYLVRDEQNRVKVGVTGSFTTRLGALQNGNADLLTLIWKRHGNLEAAFKRRFRLQHVRGEWFVWSAEMENFEKP